MNWVTNQFFKFAFLVLGLNSGPAQKDIAKIPGRADWKIRSEWQPRANGSYFVASSTAVVDACRANSNDYVNFPLVTIGIHEIYLDGRLIDRQGDINRMEVESFYDAPAVSCALLAGGKELEWRVFSPATFFAKITKFPRVEAKESYANLFGTTLNIFGFSAVLLTGLFSIFVFFGKIESTQILLIVLYNLFYAFYFFLITTGSFGFNIDPLTANKTSDFFLWVASTIYFVCLRRLELVGKRAFRALMFFAAIGIFTILIARTNDEDQLGTTFCFLGAGIMVLNLVYSSVTRFWVSKSAGNALKLVCLFIPIIIICNDICVINGLYAAPVLIPIGLVGTSFYYSLLINDAVRLTYAERDHLRTNLEQEVEIKTAELKDKTNTLEQTMSELKEAQAEIVNSAKLASLGTLSAGIAHEINNSLNYVNGSLVPLERIVNQLDPDPDAKSKKLIKMMKEGLTLTFSIIGSLRNYTGLNQAKNKNVRIASIVGDVLNIVRSKIPAEIVVQQSGDTDLMISGNVVGLNQILMNLITNAVDAMKKGGTLRLSWSEQGETEVLISVADSGEGIPESIRNKIFDPFFTTKDVGKGTGLGLHIVKKEIERHGGHIEIESKVGVGTEFKLFLPKTGLDQERKAA